MNEEYNQEPNSAPEVGRDRVILEESVSEIHHSHFGRILGIIIVLLVLVLGGLYLWGAMLVEEENSVVPRTIQNNEPETPRSEANVQILDTVSPSDEISAIEADLESTDLEDLDADLEEIDRELDAALGE